MSCASLTAIFLLAFARTRKRGSSLALCWDHIAAQNAVGNHERTSVASTVALFGGNKLPPVVRAAFFLGFRGWADLARVALANGEKKRSQAQ
jgi:hypothetical protein